MPLIRERNVVNKTVRVGNFRCRLCGHEHLSLCLRFKNAPQDVSKLLRKNECGSDKGVPLKVYRCEKCDFVQLRKMMKIGFYDDYLMGTSHSQQMRRYQKLQAESFVKRFSLKGRRVIEVGCGDGSFLKILRRQGVDACGIEPSKRFRDIGRGDGLKVFSGYVCSKINIPGAPFDAFVARQTLEHIFDVNDFLLGIKLAVKDGGVGLIEVPSLDQTMEHVRFYDFFQDHVNYFSFHTLGFALARNNFSVLEMKRSMNNEYIEAYVKVNSTANFSALQQSVSDLTDDLHRFVSMIRRRGAKVAIWGAGAKGITALAVTGISNIEYVVDSDPHKRGMFTRVSHLRVVEPEYIRRHPVNVIIISALAYRDEIVTQLRNQLGFSGVIACLGRKLQILKNKAE